MESPSSPPRYRHPLALLLPAANVNVVRLIPDPDPDHHQSSLRTSRRFDSTCLVLIRCLLRITTHLIRASRAKYSYTTYTSKVLTGQTNASSTSSCVHHLRHSVQPAPLRHRHPPRRGYHLLLLQRCGLWLERAEYNTREL